MTNISILIEKTITWKKASLRHEWALNILHRIDITSTWRVFQVSVPSAPFHQVQGGVWSMTKNRRGRGRRWRRSIRWETWPHRSQNWKRRSPNRLVSHGNNKRLARVRCTKIHPPAQRSGWQLWPHPPGSRRRGHRNWRAFQCPLASDPSRTWKKYVDCVIFRLARLLY